MHIRFKTVWLRTPSARTQLRLREAVRQLQSLGAEKAEHVGTESSKRINELPDRGRDIETKTVADPHSKPVQE